MNKFTKKIFALVFSLGIVCPSMQASPGFDLRHALVCGAISESIFGRWMDDNTYKSLLFTAEAAGFFTTVIALIASSNAKDARDWAAEKFFYNIAGNAAAVMVVALAAHGIKLCTERFDKAMGVTKKA